MVAITVVLLVIVIFLQSLVVKISDVNSKVDTLFSEMDKMSTVSGNIIATISRKNDQINAQLSRLSSIPFLGQRYNSPKTLGGQQALLAYAAREQGSDGKPVDRFKVDVPQNGQVTVNGKPLQF